MLHVLGEEIFTVEEAALFAKVTESKIREWFDRGLRHMQTAANTNRTGPRMVIVRKSSLLEWVEANEVGAPVQAQEKAPAPKPQKPKKSSRGSGQFDPNTWVAGRD